MVVIARRHVGLNSPMIRKPPMSVHPCAVISDVHRANMAHRVAKGRPGNETEGGSDQPREKDHSGAWVRYSCTRWREEVALSARGEHNSNRFPLVCRIARDGCGPAVVSRRGYMHRGHEAGAGIIRRIPVFRPMRKSGPGRHGKGPTTLRKRH